MANQKHLDILKQGVERWNQWRGEHAKIEVDLSHADLSGADLREANLSRALQPHFFVRSKDAHAFQLAPCSALWAALARATART